MQQLKKIIFSILLILFFVEILIIFPKKLEQKPERVNPATTADEMGDASQQASGVHLVESTQGQRDWELFADRALSDADQSEWSIKAVKVVFYGNEKSSFTVVGNEGKINMKNKDMVITGAVRTVTSNGYLLASEKIIYTSRKKLLEIPSSLQLKGPRDENGAFLTIRGGSMQGLIGESVFKISGHVKANHTSVQGKPVEVESETATLSSNSQSVKFEKNVKVLFGTTEIKGPVCEFNFDPKKHTLVGLNMSQGLNLVDGDKSVVAQNLIVDFAKDIYTFNGKPIVRQNEDEISGEQIVFSEGGKKMKVEKIRAKVENKP